MGPDTPPTLALHVWVADHLKKRKVPVTPINLGERGIVIAELAQVQPQTGVGYLALVSNRYRSASNAYQARGVKPNGD